MASRLLSTALAVLAAVRVGSGSPLLANPANAELERRDGSQVTWVSVFGDSLSSNGFDVNGEKPNPGNPLGNTKPAEIYVGGAPNWVQIAATQLNASLTYTYDFAFLAATVDEALISTNKSITKDFVHQYQEWVNSVANKPTWAQWTPDKHLFVVWIGWIDVGISFEQRPQEQLSQLYNTVLDRYFGLLNDAYRRGIRKFAIWNTPKLSQVPIFAKKGQAAMVKLDAAVELWNHVLSYKIINWKPLHQDASVWSLDASVGWNKAFQDPVALCGLPASGLFFDGIHPGPCIQHNWGLYFADSVRGPWYTSTVKKGGL